jgi:hypothetical protein
MRVWGFFRTFADKSAKTIMRKVLSFISLVLLLAACKPGKEVKNEVFNLPAVEDIAMYQVNPRVFAPGALPISDYEVLYSAYKTEMIICNHHYLCKKN